MKTKKLLAIHLNEFNYDFLKYGSKKYKFKYLKKLVTLNRIKTFTKDKKQNKNLDPWVQGVSISSGKSSKYHKIFKLGQRIPNDLINIWDILSKKKIDCSVWGPMNANYKKNKYIKLFFPDPWNHTAKPFPKNLHNLHKLPRYYAKNYLDVNIFQIIWLSFLFTLSVLSKKIIFFTLKNIDIIFKSLALKGIKNYVLFFLFDLISVHILSLRSISNNKHFSFIFLNSLAHYQHNNWDEKGSEKLYFAYVDRILEYVFKLYNTYDSLLIFNGFEQKKIKVEYLIRPINPEIFIKKIISFKKLEQDMTNGGFIFFNNYKDANNAYIKMKNYDISGLNLFELNQKNRLSFYYKINLKTLKDLKSLNLEVIPKKELIECFEYEKKIKAGSKKRRVNIEEIKNFLDDVKLIKTTGKHNYRGDIFFKNIKIKKNIKTIENHKIFNLIKNYYS